MVNTQIKVKKAAKNVSILPIDYKNSISDAIANHISEQGNSLDSLRASLQSIYGKGVSKSYLSNIKNKQFAVNKTQISDNDFLLLGEYFNIHFENKIWEIIETPNFLDCYETFNRAKKSKVPVCLHGATGTGKTKSADAYQKEFSKDTFYVRCKQSMSKKELVQQICNSVNVRPQNSNLKNMEAVARKMRGINNPLIIIDEAEHLNANKFNLLKGLYDDTLNKLAMVIIMTTDEFERFGHKASKGLGTFPQVFSRLAGTNHAIMNFDLGIDLPFILSELNITSSGWFTKSAYKWLIDKGQVTDYRKLSNTIIQAYTEFKEKGKPITWDDMEYLFPKNDQISF